jgi:hypothetical protein
MPSPQADGRPKLPKPISLALFLRSVFFFTTTKWYPIIVTLTAKSLPRARYTKERAYGVKLGPVQEPGQALPLRPQKGTPHLNLTVVLLQFFT